VPNLTLYRVLSVSGKHEGEGRKSTIDFEALSGHGYYSGLQF
jgi:hypothetical protein